MPADDRAAAPAPTLAELHRRHPNVRVQIYDNSAVEIVARVRAGEADFDLTVVSTRAPESEALIRISAGAANRLLIDEALNRRREVPRWGLEVQCVPTALGMVRAGLGITVLHNPFVARRIGLISLRDRPASALADELTGLVKQRTRSTAPASPRRTVGPLA